MSFGADYPGLVYPAEWPTGVAVLAPPVAPHPGYSRRMGEHFPHMNRDWETSKQSFDHIPRMARI